MRSSWGIVLGPHAPHQQCHNKYDEICTSGDGQGLVLCSKVNGAREWIEGLHPRFAIKIVDNAHHMQWMYGVGTIIYDYMLRAMNKLRVQIQIII